MLGRANRLALAAGLGLVLAAPLTGTAWARDDDPARIEQLQKVIDAQQQQLEAQQRQLELQNRHLEQIQHQINSLLQSVHGTSTDVASTGAAATDSPAVPVTAPSASPSASPSTSPHPDDDPIDDGWPAPGPDAADAQGSDILVTDDDAPADLAPVQPTAPEPNVKASNPRVKVTLSGQVNRAVNVVDDGQDTDAFFVDNDASNSRFRLTAEGKLSKDALVGSLIEVAISPNNSENVSQEDQDTEDFIDLRRVEVYFGHQDYGRLWLGKGSTSSDNTAEVDLSGTDVVMYSGVADIVAGTIGARVQF